MVRTPQIPDPRIGRSARSNPSIKIPGTRHKYDVVRGDVLRIKRTERREYRQVYHQGLGAQGGVVRVGSGDRTHRPAHASS